MRPRTPRARLALGHLLIGAAIAAAPAAAEAASCQPNCPKPFLSNNQVQSTTPANGDVNPYGVAFVPNGFPTNGVVQPGDLLIANFNNAKNLQGTGTSIVQIRLGTIQAPGAVTRFATTGAGAGLALGIARAGFVVQGLTDTTDGLFGTIKSGGLVFFDQNGTQKFTFAGVNAPWGLALHDQTAAGVGGFANIFVSNLNPGLVTDLTNGSRVGTVTRLDVRFVSIRGGPIQIVVNQTTIIGSGYLVQPNAGALVLGPAGLAYDAVNDILYVASQADNALFAIAQAVGRTTSVGGITPGTLIVQSGRLRAPTGLMLAPNGDLLTANNDAVNPSMASPSEIVEFTPTGGFVRQMNVDQAIAGAFGLGFGTDFGTNGNQLRFAFVDDNTVTATIFSCPAAGC